MAIQSQAQIADNLFVVTSVVPSTVDPTRNVVTMKALVPGTNTNGVKIGQSYALADATLTSNNNGGATVNPGPGAGFPIA